MDGTVTAEDTPGGGLTMVVSLPAVGRPPDPAPAPPDPAPDPAVRAAHP